MKMGYLSKRKFNRHFLINLRQPIFLVSDLLEREMNIVKLAVLILGATLLLGFVSCGSNDGEEIPYKRDSVFYLSPVTADEANRFLDFMVDNEQMDGEEPGAHFQLRKVGETYELKASVKEGISLDVAEPFMSQMACALRDSVFGGSDVEVDIVKKGDFDKILRRSLCLN